jgi:hypothetical protein
VPDGPKIHFEIAGFFLFGLSKGPCTVLKMDLANMFGKKGRKAGGVWVGEDFRPFVFTDGCKTSFFLVRVSFYIMSFV